MILDKMPDFQEGAVLLIDKPLTWTSFAAVKKLRYHLKIKKIGHAGTLDPLATGLLILCTGKKTKSIEQYQAQEKEYIAKICLGGVTPSYDLETEVTPVADPSHLLLSDIRAALCQFKGAIQQQPPIFSAIKKKGKKLYEYARKGETVEIPTRQVTVHDIVLEKIDLPYITLKICCSKGTYVRSLAHDIGKVLEVGGHLVELRRTRIGDFKVEDALEPQEFIDQIKSLSVNENH